MKQIPPFRNRRDVFYLVHKEPTRDNENGLYIVKPTDNSYRSIWIVVWGVPIKLIDTKDGYTKNEVNDIIDSINGSIKDVSESLDIIKRVVDALEKNKLDKELLNSISLGLNPKGEVDSLEELNKISNPKKGWSYIVNNQKDSFGNRYIFVYDDTTSKWINSKLTAFNNTLSIVDTYGDDKNKILSQYANFYYENHYYVSRLFEKGGVDNTYKYTLEKAINILVETYPLVVKRGVIITFINLNKELVSYRFFKESTLSYFKDINNWDLISSFKTNHYKDLTHFVNDGFYIATGQKEIGEEVDFTLIKDTATSIASSLVLEAKEKDVFFIKSLQDGRLARLVSFVDKDNKLLYKSDFSYTDRLLLIEAPKNTSKVIFNYRNHEENNFLFKLKDNPIGILLNSFNSMKEFVVSGINDLNDELYKKTVGREEILGSDAISIDDYAVNTKNGSLQKADTIGDVGVTDFIICKDFNLLNLTMRARTSRTVGGLAFYDRDKNFIGYYKEANFAEKDGTIQAKIEVPRKAMFFRTTYWINTADKGFKEFSCICYVKSKNGLVEDVELIKDSYSFNYNNDIKYEQGAYLLTGNIATSGDLYNRAIHSNLIPIPSEGLTFQINRHFSFRLYLFDKYKNFVSRDNIPYSYKHLKKDKSNYEYCGISIFKDTWGRTQIDIKPDEHKIANLKITKGYIEKTYHHSFKKILDYELIPKISMPLTSSTISMPLKDKVELFENTLNKIPNAEIKITNIGKDQSGIYDMFGYEIILSKQYSHTIAFTSHIHGNEKYNPTGLIALFHEMTRDNLSSYNIKWLKENTRWVGVFVCNPWGYVRNSRTQSNNVNLNRNFDYAWLENKTDDVAHKGLYASSEQETKNIIKFFEPFIDDIDCHIDWHDVSLNKAYSPATNTYNHIDREINETRLWLEHQNYASKSTLVPYINAAGSTTNQFSDTWGIMSITSEQSPSYWLGKNYSLQGTITKCLEMNINLLVPLINNSYNGLNGTLYDKQITKAYRSEKYALNTWTDKEYLNKTEELSLWDKILYSNDYYLFSNNNYKGNNNESILIIIDDNDSDNISKLTALRFMQEVESLFLKQKDCFINSLIKQSKINILLTPKKVDNYLDYKNIITDTKAYLVIHISGELINEPKNISISKNGTHSSYELDNMSTYSTKEYYDNENIDNEDDIEQDSNIPEFIYYLGENYRLLKLRELLPNSDRYGFIVAEWLRDIINTISTNSKLSDM